MGAWGESLAPELVKHCEMVKDAARAMKLSVSGIKTILNGQH